MKYWINNIPGNVKLIIWDGNKIYKANPNEIKLREYECLLKRDEIPEGIFSIFLTSIRMIEMDESKKYICIHFGTDSYEHFRISNPDLKKEIFNELSKIENTISIVKELTLHEKTKAQERAFIVLTILFLIGFIFSWNIEYGILPEGSYPVILLFLGGLGIRNIILTYLIVILIIGIKFYLNRKTQRIIHTIILKNWLQ